MDSRDPFHQEIVDALDRGVDGNAFEAAACRLLVDLYPRLTPMPGGDDAGMDGMLIDDTGRVTPLVATVQKDVIGNLSRNLETFRKKVHDTSGDVIVATTRRLSARRKINLQARAKEKGFLLIGIHDRADIVNRLVGDQAEARQLLGVLGRPPTLSTVQPGRPPRHDHLVGRDTEIDWLGEQTQDILIIGQPGIGKSSLCAAVLSQLSALFVTGRDLVAIADEIRSKQPRTLIVDDGHNKLELIEFLVQLRRDVRAGFALLVTCWPGREGLLTSLLDEFETLQLKPLTDKQISLLIRSLGGPDGFHVLSHEIVSAARGRPGLAITLTDVALGGDWQRILEGETILRWVGRYLDDSVIFLGALVAVGGSQGVNRQKLLGLGIDSQQSIDKLLGEFADVGVLETTGNDGVAIVPKQLRAALLSRKPPEKSFAQSLDEIIDEIAVSERASVEGLIDARLRRATISSQFLRQRANKLTHFPGILNALALVSPEDGHWVLEHSVSIYDHAEAVLQSIPCELIPILLSEETLAEVANTNNPVAVIKNWIQEALGDQTQHRFCCVLGAAEAASGNTNQSMLEQGLAVAMSPTRGRLRFDASGDGIQLGFGHLPEKDLEFLIEQWPKVLSHLNELGQDAWGLWSETIRFFIHPHPSAAVGDNQLSKGRELATLMLNDLATKFEHRTGLTVSISRIARRNELAVDVEADSTFDRLFPDFVLDSSSQDRPANLSDIAESWIEQGPVDAAFSLKMLLNEAASVGITETGRTGYVARLVIENTDDHDQWIRALVAVESPWVIIRLFLVELGIKNAKLREMLLKDLLQHPIYSIESSRFVLNMESPPAALLQTATVLLRECPRAAWIEILRGAVALNTIRRLLMDESPELALAAAIGEWDTNPQDSVRPELLGLFIDAVLKSANFDDPPLEQVEYGLRKILPNLPDLAAKWLGTWSVNSSSTDRRMRGIAAEAMKSLDSQVLDDIIQKAASSRRPEMELAREINRISSEWTDITCET